MTIKEIAELCGVKKQTVWNWANKLEVLNQKIWLRLSEKLKQGSPESPSDYDLEETLAIIGEGGGNKALASLLADNAAQKAAVRLLQEPEKAVAEGAGNIVSLISGMNGHKYLQAALTGKAKRCRKTTYTGGGRVYAIPTTKRENVFNVFVYTNRGKLLREGFAMRGGFHETVESLVQGYDMGGYITCEDVDVGDMLAWLAGCSLRAPWGTLLAAPEDAAGSGNILEFKPLKAFGA
jgi:hypothetical protein